MKKISLLFLICLYILTGCGQRHNHTAEANHQEHGADCEHGHEAGKEHAHSTECTHDHKTENTHSDNCDHLHEDGKPHSHADNANHKHDHGHAGDSHAGHSHGSANTSTEAPELGPGEIFFSDEQASISVFGLYTVEPQIFHQVIPASGRILAAQGDEYTAAATFNGIVSFSSKKIAPGTAVSRGESLFYISSRDIAEGDLVTRTTAAYEQARTAYERAQRLIEDRIITQSEYEAAKLNYETAEAGYDALALKSGGKGTAVTAGISGFIKNVNVTEGQYVEVGQPLATVAQNRRLVLQADVSQKYYQALRSVTGANFSTPYDNRTYRLDKLNGRLISSAKASADNSAFLTVTFEFDNKGDLLAGSVVEIYLLSAARPNVLTVPLTALAEEQGLYFVYCKIGDELYFKQQVQPGANDGRSVEILSGLKAGDSVVSQGVSLVKMAAFSGAIPHGHEH